MGLHTETSGRFTSGLARLRTCLAPCRWARLRPPTPTAAYTYLQLRALTEGNCSYLRLLPPQLPLACVISLLSCMFAYLLAFLPAGSIADLHTCLPAPLLGG